jgi:hypothetical protein
VRHQPLCGTYVEVHELVAEQRLVLCYGEQPAAWATLS